MERLWLGQALHVRVQCANQARDPSYRREVPLETRFAHAGWQILIHGRADGVREEATGHFVVEEIKSVRRGHTQQFRENPLARLQAATYAWMLARERGVPARAELVWIEIGSDRIAREPVAFDAAELEAALGGQIDAHLARFERRRHLRAARSRAATRLRFPRERLRPGQERMIQAVTSALENGEHLLLQASTGSGKTLACLFPALQFALGRDQRIYVVTPKNLQQQTVMDALVELDPGGSPIAVRLRAKERMCANRTMICHDQYCEFARDFSTKLADGLTVRRILRDHPVLASEDLYAAAVAARLCPFELSRIAAREALVTVCDYNHVFDPVASLGEFSPRADLSETILIIDEVHNLVDRARQIASPILDAESIRRAHRAVELGGAKIHRALSALCLELLELVEAVVEEAAPGASHPHWSVEHALPRDRLFALRSRFDAAFLDHLEYRIDTRSLEGEDPFVTLHFALLRFLEFLSDASDGFAELVERTESGGRLRLLCKDPSRRLGSLFRRCRSVIGLSATLQPLEVFRDLLGMDPERSAAVTVPSAFPRERQRVVIDTSVTTGWRSRKREIPRIARRIAEFASAVPGHCLALLPSHAFLAEVADRLPATDKKLLRQPPKGRDDEHAAILAEIRNSRADPILLLAVTAGVFAEGIDYPDGALRGVLVVGPCLPVPNLEREILEREYEERFGRGFDCAYAIPGMTRVVQAAGRLIRSENDTGVIALLDRRFLREPYRDLLPDAWLDGRAPEQLVGHSAHEAERFFASLDV